jgi:hypothetical protein
VRSAKAPSFTGNPPQRKSEKGSHLKAFVSSVAAALVLVLAVGATSASASDVESNWELLPAEAGRVSRGIGADPLSGDVFTGMETASTTGRVEKWTADGLPGTPPAFGNGLTPNSKYAGVGVDPTDGDVYALVDWATAPKIAIFESDGTPVGAPFSVATDKPVDIDVDAAGNVYVPNPAEGVVNKYSPAGALLLTFGPNPGGTPLNDPESVAVDSAGDVYVADRATKPVNEVQKLNLHGATGGTFKLGFDGASTGATLTADIHAATGSGDVVRAEGTGTTQLLASASGNIVKGSSTVTGVSGEVGHFAVGESIATLEFLAEGGGIRPGTTITALGAGTITLSAPATKTATGIEILSGSKTITGVEVSEGGHPFEVGMTVEGAGIPTMFNQQEGIADTITAVGPNSITLAYGVTGEEAGQELSASKVVNVTTTGGAYEAGEFLKSSLFFGGLLPVPIVAVGSGTLTVASVAGVSANGTSLPAGAKRLTDVHVLSGQISPDIGINGPGVLPASATEKVTVDRGQDFLNLEGGELKIGGGILRNPVTSVPPGGDTTDVPLNADLWSSSSNTPFFGELLDAMPTIGAARTFDAGFSSVSAEIANVSAGAGNLTFTNALGGRNLPPMTCDGSKLTGGSPAGTCDVSTEVNGSSTPGRVVKFDAGGSFVSNFVDPGPTSRSRPTARPAPNWPSSASARSRPRRSGTFQPNPNRRASRSRSTRTPTRSTPTAATERSAARTRPARSKRAASSAPTHRSTR